jgi:hypothetical protein
MGWKAHVTIELTQYRGRLEIDTESLDQQNRPGDE